MKPLTKLLEDILTLNNARDFLSTHIKEKTIELSQIDAEISTLSQGIPALTNIARFIYKEFLFLVRGDQVEINKIHEHKEG